RTISADLALRVLARFRTAMRVQHNNTTKRLVLVHPVFGPIGALRRNLKTYSLVGPAKHLRVVDQDGGRQSLSSWLGAERALHLVYSDVRYAYAENQLFRDDGLLSQLPSLRAMIQPEACLSTE